jgi:hypothetical protein
MVAGVRGHLISIDLLAERVRAQTRDVDTRRRLIEWRARCASLGPAASLRAMIDVGVEPFVRILGFSGLADIRYEEHQASAALVGRQPIALLVTPWGDSLEPMWRPAVVASRSLGAEWCVLFNGQSVRLVDARRVYSRRFVELDLDIAADDFEAAGALMMLFGAGAFTAVDGLTSIAIFVADSERHGAAVCRDLRDGVLHASAAVLNALTRGRRLNRADPFDQALTIVYRLLFLLFAEARSLVPMWNPLYRDNYSVASLRETAERLAAAPGLWDALRAVSRIAHSGCVAGELRVTPFNGRLFAPSRTPLAERRDLDNEAIGRAVLALATRPAADGMGREPIAYRDLGVEQLGAVYETLLDYIPSAEPSEQRGVRPPQTLHRGSGLRKATGTFYTPQPLAHYLVRRTLTPLVHDVPPERILDLKVVDPAMGSGAFLVAACEFLAAAYELALVRSGSCHPTDLGPSDRAAIRRTVAERCLYGVDSNPMAVQLARLSLWLTTLAADRPLTFLDHHLQTGDSLVGAWLANLRHPPATRRTRHHETLPLFDTALLSEALRDTVPGRFALAVQPADTVDQVREKERLLAALSRRDASLARWKRVADLWCAAWFDPQGAPASAFGDLSDAILTDTGALPPSIARPLLRRAEDVAADRRFFHWELEFPEVFFDRQGARLAAAGFDAVLGNPPWDMIRADTGSVDARDNARLQAGALVRFTRDSGVYASQSDGHANRYQLFLERALHLARRGGRLGLVLPSGLVADHGSARLRQALLTQSDVDAIVGFDNRSGVFPIHRSVRFVLLTATRGQPTREIACRLGERSPAALESAGADTDEGFFPVRVTPSLLERLTGADLALPELTTPLDLRIAERAAALFPALSDPAGWGATFGRELNATDDRGCFQNAGTGLPVLEGKHIEPFGCRLHEARWTIARKHAERLLGDRHRHWRLGYRDVASATNKTTLIAALVPPDAVTTHTIFCLRTPLRRHLQHLLCGLFNSLVVNYLVRLRVTTHVTTAIVERLPIPTVDRLGGYSDEVAALSLALVRLKADTTSAPNNSTDVVSGFSRTRVTSSLSRTQLFARLNALAAGIYQLSEAEFSHVLATFPLVPHAQRDEALAEFRKAFL